jgi:ribonuclease HI
MMIWQTITKDYNVTLSFWLDFSCINNQAKYEALIIGLKILQDLGAISIQLIGDCCLLWTS